MKKDDINIIEASMGGKVKKVRYDHLRESRPYTVEEEETPHPDLKMALDAFKMDMAEAYGHLDQDAVSKFTVNEFHIEEKAKTFSINLKGKMETTHSETVNVTSGPIPIVGDLIEKLATVRDELFKYVFEGKSTQHKIPFPGEKEKKEGKDGKDE